ncbi:MAG: hypothetical protein L0241_31070, partial [Planctomycetia bacterium]|nr:hypothetical protein [Planctomycetia bacterium]
MSAGRRSWFVAALILAGTIVPLANSKDLNPGKQLEEQKKIKARVEDAARRASSTLDAMMFQKLTPKAEQQMLREVADGLRGLSEGEIKQVLDHLEKAVSAPDPKTATDEQKAAFAKHLDVMRQLRVMLGQLNVIRTLDEAAEQLEIAAEKQLKLVLAGHTQTIRPVRGRPVVDDREQLANDQADLRLEVLAVFKGIKALVDDNLLTPEQLARVQRAEVLVRGVKLTTDMTNTTITVRSGDFTGASERQRRHAKELKDLAKALRTPLDRLETLKVAQAQVTKAIDAQTKLNNDTTEKPDPAEELKLRRQNLDPKAVRANELANQQTKAAFLTSDARKTLHQVAPEVADLLKPAETNQWKSEDELRDKDLPGAMNPQEKALEQLKNAKDELDRLIAAAELAKSDPLAATKQAIEQLDQIIKEQKDANAKTEKAVTDPNSIPKATTAQKDVTKKTEDLRNTPLPPNTEAKKALDKAFESQKQAGNQLDNKNPTDAQPKQQDALTELLKAKEELEKQAKAIEERREQIAQLEELKKKLDELVKNEKEIANDANKAANDPKKPDTGDLAKKQDDLTEPTKDVGKQLENLVPEAAKKVGEAGMKQNDAKNDLGMNMPMAGGEKAKEAADKLADAAKDVQKQLDMKKGQEAADQAALQPNKVDPQQAAAQLAKAIEQANMAAEKAKEAAKTLDPMGMNEGMKDLVELQKEIAKQAADQKIPEAAKAADMATEALKKGDFPNAIENQQKALDELKKAAMAQPNGMMNDKGM